MTIESKDRAALRKIQMKLDSSCSREAMINIARDALAQPDPCAERDGFAARLLVRNTRLTAALLEMLSCFADLGGTRGPRAAAVAAARAVLEGAPEKAQP